MASFVAVVIRERFVQFVQPGSQIHGKADEILASKTPYFALKSVRIGKKNLNTKLPQHESLYNNTVI